MHLVNTKRYIDFLETFSRRYLTLTCFENPMAEKQKVKLFSLDKHVAKKVEVNKINHDLKIKIKSLINDFILNYNSKS